jgi:hypothetical protein
MEAGKALKYLLIPFLIPSGLSPKGMKLAHKNLEMSVQFVPTFVAGLSHRHPPPERVEVVATIFHTATGLKGG